MNNINKLNRYIEKTCTYTGQNAIDVLMELSLLAGIDDFNPYKADEGQLTAIALAIPEEKDDR
jgi:hypothetical protein